MLVFWRRGYEATSLSDLTEAMGINRPSLYAAFGNKESLFRKVLERYGEGPSAYVGEALAKPTAREVAESLLSGAADLQTQEDTPAGCLSVLGVTHCAEDSSPIGEAIIAFRLSGEAAIRERFKRAQEEGDLPTDTNPEELADYIRTVVYGMAVKAASGSTREELGRVIDLTMRAWPK